jgi:hypothetical protein
VTGEAVKTKWYDRQMAASIVGGLVVAVVVWFVPWLITEATKAKVPLWIYPAVASVALVFASVAILAWRGVTWRKLRQWRPFTITKGIDDRVEAGRAQQLEDPQAAAEVVAKRLQAKSNGEPVAEDAKHVPAGVRFRQAAVWERAKNAILDSDAGRAGRAGYGPSATNWKGGGPR